MILNPYGKTKHDGHVDGYVHVDFPIQWGKDSDGRGNPQVVDPAVMVISVPLAEDPDDDPEFELPLIDAINDLLWMNRCGGLPEGEVHPDAHQFLRCLADRLREIASHIDNEITRGTR